MKRFWIFLLCLGLLLSFSACQREDSVPIEIGTDGADLTVTQGEVVGWAEGAVEFSPHYLHTNGGKELVQYPLVRVIRSAEALDDYVSTEGQNFDLRELSALHYDQSFFASNALILIVLEEPSSSIRHKVEEVHRRVENEETSLRVDIASIVPETGDTAMAQWHIVLEIPQNKTSESDEDISVYTDGLLMKGRVPTVTYCFGTESSTTFSDEMAELLLDILQNLNYDPSKLCNGSSQYQVKTEKETYGINLREGYARCSAGQAALTEEQLTKLSEIHDWAKEQPADLCGYPKEEYFRNFSFALTWGCYGESSYDSATGILVKTENATNPAEYVTKYYLSEERKEQVYALIQELDLGSYPDFYDPHEGTLGSDPSMTLVLSVSVNGTRKTVQAKDIALGYQAKNEKGQRFLTVCQKIASLLTDTEEWKALPEYEFFYN